MYIRKRNICRFWENATFRSALRLIAKNARESKVERALVFSALSGVRMFSPVASHTHGNSDARSADGKRWKGIYMREFYRAS